MPRVKKQEAVRRLRTAGAEAVANELEGWHDKNGNDWGWDGWIRGAHPVLIPIIWSH